MIKCLIVDDEQHAIDILVHYVEQCPQLQLVGTTNNPLEALKMAGELKPDLMFVDVQMPELSGLDLIKAIGGRSRIILTTAYSEFALESYELDVVDYLLKPISLPRFVTAVQKVVGEFESREHRGGDEEDYIFVKTEIKGKLLKIELDDIDYLEGMKNYVAFHRGGQKTLVYTSMKEIEERLPRHKFIRVHKSFIIPIQKITGIEGNMVRLEQVPEGIQIGELYKGELMEIIRGKMIQ